MTLPKHTKTVAGQSLLVGLDLHAKFGRHRYDPVAELHLRATVDDALGGTLHDHQALSVRFGLLLDDVHLVLVLRVERDLEQVGVGLAVFVHVAERLAELDHGDLGRVTHGLPCHYLRWCESVTRDEA